MMFGSYCYASRKCTEKHSLGIGYINGAGEISTQVNHALIVIEEKSKIYNLNPEGDEFTCYEGYFNDGEEWFLTFLEEVYLRREEFKNADDAPLFPTEKDLNLAIAEMIFKKEYEKFEGLIEGPTNAWELLLSIVQTMYTERVKKDVSVTLDGWNEAGGIYDDARQSLKERSLLLIGKGSGNLYSNVIYERFLDDAGLTPERLKKFANLQVSSPTINISALHSSFGDYLSSKQDVFLKKFNDGYPTLGSNISMEIERYVANGNTYYPVYHYQKVDPLGSDFTSVYLSDTLKGKLDGEEFYRPMSSILMRKLSVLTDKIFEKECIEGLSFKVYRSPTDLGPDRFIYPILYDSNGNMFEGDLDQLRIYTLKGSDPLEFNNLTEALDKNGNPLEFNKVNYVSEVDFWDQYGSQVFYLFHTDDLYRLESGEAQKCSSPSGSRSPLFSMRVNNKYDTRYVYNKYEGLPAHLDISTVPEIVSASFGNEEMRFVGNSATSYKDCANGGFFANCTFSYSGAPIFPNELTLRFVTGESVKFPLTIPESPGFDFNFERSGEPYFYNSGWWWRASVSFILQPDAPRERVAILTDYWETLYEGGYVVTGMLGYLGGLSSNGYIYTDSILTFECGKKGVAAPIQKLIGTIGGEYYRFEDMIVINNPCSADQIPGNLTQ